MRFKLDQLLDTLEFSEKQVVNSTKEIRRFCKEDAELSQSIAYLMRSRGSARLWLASFWRAWETGVKSTMSGNWEAFWAWCQPRTPREIGSIGARLPASATDGFEVS